jgi:hypothetical protein
MICSLHEPVCAVSDGKRRQRKTGGHYERPQSNVGLTLGAKARPDNGARNRYSGAPRTRHGLGASTRVPSEPHLTKIQYKSSQVGGHHRSGRRVLERDLYKSVLYSHRGNAEHGSKYHDRRVRIGHGANPDADREKAGKEQKLQEQQRPQGGNPGPIESCRQKSRCNEGDDKHRNGQQMRRGLVLARSGSCRKDHQIAGSVGDEQGPQPEEPDHVHTACNDAQHKSQQLPAERIADRFHGLRFFRQRFKLSSLR